MEGRTSVDWGAEVRPHPFERCLSASAVLIAAVSGEMDYLTGPEFRAAAQRLLESPAQHLVLEMSGVDFLDSAGLNDVLRLSKRAAEGGGCLVLAAVPTLVRQVLSLTGADAVLPVYAQVADARNEPR
ncbi:anti-sigma factor antagonist [Streptomyces sp. NPDC012510]|uniref:STAS domain-containing protein n=1 Tax=Streptomyces sp. NPDC012510 TaxID=3364838 RepID=UPI0036E19E05